MGFPKKVKEEVLLKSKRHCCLCNKFCGIKIDVHHIKPKSEGGEDTVENAIPLCFDCHADMRTYDARHPVGNKYSESELKSRRNILYKNVTEGVIVEPRDNGRDIEVYNTLLKKLPWNGSIAFIRNHNFAGFSFQTDKLNDLWAFDYLCENPSFYFLDEKLEESRKKLLHHINELGHAIGQYTFPTDNLGWNTVLPEWERTQPLHFKTVVDLIHTTVENICNEYDFIIKKGTEQLNIIPIF